VSAGSIDEALTDLSLAHDVVDRQTPKRKVTPLAGIGGSSIAFLAVAFGYRKPAEAPAWIREKARPMPRHGGMIKGLAQSIGLAANGTSDSLKRGNKREPEILAAWIDKLEAGDWQTEDEREIDPASIQWAGAMPIEWSEHCDRHSPLVVHPDAWARTWKGELVTVDLKCSHYGYASPAWWNGATVAPWYYGTQLDAYHAVMRSTRGLIVVGCGWNRDANDPREDGPVIALPHHATAEGSAFARRIAVEAWDRVPQVYRA
jgi:hypothetical protein